MLTQTLSPAPAAATARPASWVPDRTMVQAGWRSVVETHKRRPIVQLTIASPIDRGEGWQAGEAAKAYAELIESVRPVALDHPQVAKTRVIRERVRLAEEQERTTATKLEGIARERVKELEEASDEPDEAVLLRIARLDIASAKLGRDRLAAERERKAAAALVTEAYNDARFALRHYVAAKAISERVATLMAARNAALDKIVASIDPGLLEDLCKLQVAALAASNWSADAVERSLADLLGPEPAAFVPLPQFAQDPPELVESRYEVERASREAAEALNRGAVPAAPQAAPTGFARVQEYYTNEYGNEVKRVRYLPIVPEPDAPPVDPPGSDPFAATRERLPAEEAEARSMFAAAIV